jgi:uncharacterized protein YodC (DUF2158 family)
MADEIKVGDTVELKSGGPIMTVTGVGNHHLTHAVMVSCVWFDGKKQLSGSFPPTALGRKNK